MSLKIVKFSVLQIYKTPIKNLVGLANHYYLAEVPDPNLHNSLGWGRNGIEIQGKVRITRPEFERLERFLSASKYSVSLHNCEHFANYVLYGIKLCSQKDIFWKSLGADILEILNVGLDGSQSKRENYNSFINQQIAQIFAENLRQAKIERANQERIEFWKNRGISVH
jgi:hypothetical protein